MEFHGTLPLFLSPAYAAHRRGGAAGKPQSIRRHHIKAQWRLRDAACYVERPDSKANRGTHDGHGNGHQ